MRKLLFLCLLAVLTGGLAFPLPAAALPAPDLSVPLSPALAFPGQIVFTGDDGNLWLLQGDTGARYRLTQDGSQDGPRYFAPVFSPDGKRLVYLGQPSGGGALTVYLLESGSGQARAIGDNWQISSRPWSPDGQRIVYTNTPVMGAPADPGVPQGVLVYDLLTGQSTLLQAQGERELLVDAQWSPDGKRISFRDYCFECVGQFFTLDLASGARFAWSEDGSDRWVGLDTDWSPDGSRVAFDQWDFYNPPEATYGLWVGGAGGQDLRLVYTAQGQSIAFPRWSPDGSRIAFSQVLTTVEENAYRRRADLVVVAPDGTGARTLVQGSWMIYPRDWSPDGKLLLFSREGDYDEHSLAIYDLERGMAFEIGGDLAYGSADWSQAPGQPFQPAVAGESAEATWTVQPPFPIDEDALLYLSREGALVIFSSASRASLPLTPVGSVQSFSVSPSQRRIFVKGKDGQGYLLDLEPQPGGVLSIRQRMLSAPPIRFPYQEAFSPGETYFTYTDALERVWIVDRAGRQEQLAYAAGLPEWSADEQWLSVETLDRRLYVSQAQGPLRLVAEGIDRGSAAWSPARNWLAFAVGEYEFTFNEQQDTRRVMVYEAESGQARPVLEGAGLAGWSPDGQVLAATRTDSVGASAFSWTDFLVDPVTLRVQEVGSYYSRDANRRGWAAAGDAYIYGAFRAEKDLSAAGRIAPSLLAAGQDGHTFVGIDSPALGMEEEVRVFCWNDLRPERVEIADLRIGPLYGAVMPGLWARLSPDAQWAVMVYFQDEAFYARLARCDGAAQAEVLPDGALTVGIPEYYQFSENSRWLAGVVQQGESGWFLRVHALTGSGVGPAVDLPLASWDRFVWLAPLVFPAENTATPAPSATSEPAETTAPPAAVTPEAAGEGTPPPEATAPPVADPGAPVAPAAGLPISRRALLAAAVLCGGSLGLALLALLGWLLLRGARRAPAAANSPRRAVSGLEQAVQRIQAGHYQEGYDALRRVVEKNPRDAAAWHWMGVAASGSGQARTAQRCFARAAALGYNESGAPREGPPTRGGS